MKGWKHKKTISDGEEFVIEGYNIWDYKWDCDYNKEKVLDPVYGNEYDMDIVKIEVDNRIIQFGSVEFSNNIYGIYIEE